MSGITNPMDPYLWMSMGPYAWTSNYGNELQLNILPEYFTPLQARYFHGHLNPNHVCRWNPMFSIPMQDNTTDPYLTEKGLETAYEWGKNRMAELMDGMKFSQTTQNLCQIKGSLESLLKDENLSDGQKSQIQALVDKAKDLQKRLSDYKKSMQKSDADKDALRKDLEAIEKDVKSLHDESTTLIEKLKEEIENGVAAENDPEAANDAPDAANNAPDAANNAPVAASNNLAAANNAAAVEGEPGPNGTIVKDGKYYSKYDGKELSAQYAFGSEMKFNNGYSARVWANGERVLYRDKDGKTITPAQFVANNPNEYIEILNKQLENAFQDKIENVKAEALQDTASGKITAINVTYNNKTIYCKLPVDVRDLLVKLGLKTQKA